MDVTAFVLDANVAGASSVELQWANAEDVDLAVDSSERGMKAWQVLGVVSQFARSVVDRTPDMGKTKT